MKYDVSDDELVCLVRQQNEEALKMLLFRYRDIRDILIYETLNRNRYCGLEYDDMKITSIEATLLICEHYDYQKSCFFSYWKLLMERELISFLRRMNGYGAGQLNTAVSFDAGDECEQNFRLAQSMDTTHNYITEEINFDESIQRLAEANDNDLSPEEKAVLAYRVLGYSYEEIESIMHMTKRKVCRLMLRMRQKVREIAKDYR